MEALSLSDEALLTSLTLDDLPSDVLSYILELLPADQRARCAAVCRSWRALLQGPELWRTLHVDPSALSVPPEAALAGAAARAQNQLRQLMVDASLNLQLWPPFLAAVRANAGSLRLLRTGGALQHAMFLPQVESVFHAAPSLTLRCGVFADAAHAAPACLRQPPYERLRMHALAADGFRDAAELSALLVAARTHAGLRALHLLEAPLGLDAPGPAAALAQAAAELGLETLELTRCGLTAAAAATFLPQLLSRDLQLRELAIDNSGAREGLLASPAAALGAACAALRACRLTSLALVGCGVWLSAAGSQTPPSSPGILLVNALTGHPTLVALCLDENGAASHAERCAAGASLAALVGRAGCALRSLSLRGCSLRDFGVAPLMEALATGGCGLRSLALSANGLTTRCIEVRVAPALLRCASLRQVELLDDHGNEFAELREARRALAARE